MPKAGDDKKIDESPATVSKHLDGIIAMNAAHPKLISINDVRPKPITVNGKEVIDRTVVWNFTLHMKESDHNQIIADEVLVSVLSQTNRGSDLEFVAEMKKKIKTYYVTLQRKSRQTAIQHLSIKRKVAVLQRRQRVN